MRVRSLSSRRVVWEGCRRWRQRRQRGGQPCTTRGAISGASALFTSAWAAPGPLRQLAASAAACPGKQRPWPWPRGLNELAGCCLRVQ